jgi:hypothetical protein
VELTDQELIEYCDRPSIFEVQSTLAFWAFKEIFFRYKDLRKRVKSARSLLDDVDLTNFAGIAECESKKAVEKLLAGLRDRFDRIVGKVK